VIIINDGQIAAVDSLDALTTRLRKGERLLLKVRQNNSEIIKKLHALTKVNTVTEHQPAQFTIDCEPNADIQDEIAQLSLDNKWGIVELKPASMTLEDIFLKLTLEENEVQQ
jgi:ABC-2 type transport system ATP-binding protein